MTVSAPVHGPLHDRHVALGARFGEFGGWLMPLEYAAPAGVEGTKGGVLAEHEAVRTSVGVFDVSHLGTAWVRGPGAADFLNTVFTNDLGKITPGKAQYTLLCNDTGGVVDDLIAYLCGPDDVLLIPNAANCATVVALLTEAAPDGVEVSNVGEDYAIIAVQGTRSDEVLGAMGLPTGHDYMSFATVDRDGQTFTLCRTGYTGERGYELVVPAALAGGVWDEVMATGEPWDIRPAGLAARDTLRLEMGYSLHGHELTPDLNAVECGVGWAVGWRKPSFWGDAALRATKEAGPARRMRGLRAITRSIPRAGMAVVPATAASEGTDDTSQIGVITSGTFSPTLKQGIALALIDSSVAIGDVVGVQVRNKVDLFEVVKPPFVEPGVREA